MEFGHSANICFSHNGGEIKKQNEDNTNNIG